MDKGFNPSPMVECANANGSASLSRATTRGRGNVTMLARLAGVPRPVLQSVFGKYFGKRIWEQAHLGGHKITNVEIIGGIIDYACEQASRSLCKGGRRAKSIVLR